jgi:hypothetical protein
MNVRRWHDDADKGKLRYSEKKPAPGAAVSATNLTCTDLDSNTLLRRGRPANNCPSRTRLCTLHHVEHSSPFLIFKVILSQEMALIKVLPCYNHAVLGIGLNLSSFLYGRLKPSVKNPTKIPVNNKVSSFSPEGRCERLYVYLFVVGR